MSDNTEQWEIVLSGGHPDICVIVSAPEGATDYELQSLAEKEAMSKTFIWSKKKIGKSKPPNQTAPQN